MTECRATPAGEGLKILSRVLAAMCAAAVAVMGVMAYMVSKAMHDIYASMGSPLPGATAFVLALPPWTYLLASMAVSAVLIVKEAVLGSGRRAIWVSVAVSALALICLVVVVALLWLPLPGIMGSIRGGAGGQ